MRLYDGMDTNEKSYKLARPFLLCYIKHHEYPRLYDVYYINKK